jgi:acid phosphatase (class A)
MIRRLCCWAFVFAILLGAHCAAISGEFFTPSSADAAKLLPAPPSADSAETKDEMKVIRRLEEFRTPEEIVRCRTEAKLDMMAFQPVFGIWFNADNLPELNKLFKQIHEESKAVSDSAKEHFGRLRPYKLDSTVEPCIKKEDEPSYPSGHATRGIIYAMILCDLAPDKTNEIMERGREIGWDRVIAGVHYPSDVAAGRTLGQALGQSLFADPNFRQRLKKVSAEFEKVRSNQQPTAVAP